MHQQQAHGPSTIFWRGRTAYITYDDLECVGKVLDLTESLFTFSIILMQKGSDRTDKYWDVGYTYTVTVKNLQLRTLSEEQQKSLNVLRPQVKVGHGSTYRDQT